MDRDNVRYDIYIDNDPRRTVYGTGRRETHFHRYYDVMTRQTKPADGERLHLHYETYGVRTKTDFRGTPDVPCMGLGTGG